MMLPVLLWVALSVMLSIAPLVVDQIVLRAAAPLMHP